MARIRTIKPEFQLSQSMGKVTREARLAFILLWPHCDDEGRIRANSRMLASLLFPYDDDGPDQIDGWLSELELEGCVQRYVIDGADYIEVTNFLKHQRVDHPRPSLFPAPRESSRTFSKPREHSCLDQGRDQGLEGTKDQGVVAPIRATSGFEDFWNVFPRKDGSKALAEKEFKAAKADPQAVIDGARAYAMSDEAKRDEGKFSVGAVRWLQEKRWADQPKLPTPEEIEANLDKADRLFRRGKYADSYQ